MRSYNHFPSIPRFIQPPKTSENLAESLKDFSINVPLVEVDIGLLANQVGVAATDTLDLGQGVHDLLLTLNIGVEETQNVLEVRLLAGHERCELGDKLA